MAPMASNDPAPQPDGGAEELLERLLGEYVDRLTAGEAVDVQQLRHDHPAVADELIETLQEFSAFGSPDAAGVSATFGEYHVVRELARGGMGIVYEAIEAGTDRPVALKVLPAGLLLSEKAVLRFRREARIVARLRHPNIVSLYRMGFESGTPYRRNWLR